MIAHAQDLKEVSSQELVNIQALNLIKQANIEVNKAYDAQSLYLLDSTIQGQKQSIYLTKDKKYIIAGNAMDATTGSALTLPIDLSITQNKEALTFGSGKDEYILFTDPECPYCKKFESFFPQLEKFVKIKVFFYPLSFHEKAKNLSLYILSQKTNEAKIDAMLNIDASSELFIKRNQKSLASYEAHLEEEMNIARTLNISGTPTIFNKKGNKVSWVGLLKKYNIEVK